MTMAVTFTTEGPLGFITLDNPPANSYDLAFMAEFGEAVDEAVVGATRRGHRPERQPEVLLRRRRHQDASSRATSRRTWR